MNESDILIKLILSVVFGAILGLETETREIESKGIDVAKKEEKGRIGGFRTYTLISLLGGISGILYILGSELFSIILLLALVAFLISAYFLNVKLRKAFGLTTELAIIITFVLGFLTTSSLVRFEILLGILLLMAFFLSQKRGIGIFIEKVQHKELIDLIKFGLIGLLLLPLLPNQNFLLGDLLKLLNLPLSLNENINLIYLINPFSIWLIVVIISGINLLAYFLSRAFGTSKGIIYSGILGGFFSSTSTLISFASRVKNNDDRLVAKKYAGGAMLANGVSFILAGFLFAVSNISIFYQVLPILIMMLLCGILYGFNLIYSSRNGESVIEETQYEPFSLLPAIKFVSIIIGITLLIQILQIFRVNDFFIAIVTAISGVTGIDAPIIAISNLNLSGNIPIFSAILIFVLTNTINLIAKIGYSKYLGNQYFYKYILYGMIFTILSSILGLVIVGI